MNLEEITRRAAAAVEDQGSLIQKGSRVIISKPLSVWDGQSGTVIINLGRETAQMAGKEGEALFVDLDNGGGLAAVSTAEVTLEPVAEAA